ncbi:MAG: GerW family sporulation protein [Lachnospiraceae bacterium]|nr:GerW family sporulation protein [Lachnospiraceae bacterium]
MNNGFSSVMESLLKGVDSILSTKTVVGEPKQFGDTIILPLVDVTFGVGAGGSVNEKKDGAGGGLTGKMTPSAVIVIKDGHTKLVNVKNQDTVTKILDMVPDLVDKFSSKKAEKELMDDEEAKEIAFGEEE